MVPMANKTVIKAATLSKKIRVGKKSKPQPRYSSNAIMAAQQIQKQIAK